MLLQRMAQRQQIKTAIPCIRLAAANIAYGSSYIVTGNLLVRLLLNCDGGWVAAMLKFMRLKPFQHDAQCTNCLRLSLLGIIEMHILSCVVLAIGVW